MKGSVISIIVLLSAGFVICTVPNCTSKAKAITAGRTPQYLKSPNYPGTYGTYDKRLSCSWLVRADSSMDEVVIQIQVLNSSLEYSTGCVRDAVQIYDGPKDFFRPLSSWCGKTWPKKTLTSSSGAVLITFSTDFKNNDYYGFMLAYWVASKPVFMVRHQPWGTINYVLLGISLLLLTGGPGCLLGLYIKRYVLPKLCSTYEKME